MNKYLRDKVEECVEVKIELDPSSNNPSNTSAIYGLDSYLLKYHVDVNIKCSGEYRISFEAERKRNKNTNIYYFPLNIIVEALEERGDFGAKWRYHKISIYNGSANAGLFKNRRPYKAFIEYDNKKFEVSPSKKPRFKLNIKEKEIPYNIGFYIEIHRERASFFY